MLLNQNFTTIILHQRYVELIILFSIGILLFVCIFISILFILINLILILFFHSYTFSHSISSTLNFIRILFFHLHTFHSYTLFLSYTFFHLHIFHSILFFIRTLFTCILFSFVHLSFAFELKTYE